MVRRFDERSEELRGMGIELVIGDFADYTTLVAALEGIEAAYFCYPVGAGLTEAAGLFAAAGRKQDLRRPFQMEVETLKLADAIQQLTIEQVPDHMRV